MSERTVAVCDGCGKGFIIFVDPKDTTKEKGL